MMSKSRIKSITIYIGNYGEPRNKKIISCYSTV